MRHIERVTLFWVACLAQGATAPPIAVFLDFETQPSEISVSFMKEEVSAILKPSGLALNWQSLAARAGGQSFADLVVVKFRGSCQVRDPMMDSELSPAIVGTALASTIVSEGRVLPFSDVKCDEIRRFLASNLAAIAPQKQDAVYGKALGRVVAHELYHIFAATEEHSVEGVARASHSRRELTARRFRFSPQETTLLHELKWRALLAGEAEAVIWQAAKP